MQAAEKCPLELLATIEVDLQRYVNTSLLVTDLRLIARTTAPMLLSD